jgi:hypothetical protein
MTSESSNDEERNEKQSCPSRWPQHPQTTQPGHYLKINNHQLGSNIILRKTITYGKDSQEIRIKTDIYRNPLVWARDPAGATASGGPWPGHSGAPRSKAT